MGTGWAIATNCIGRPFGDLSLPIDVLTITKRSNRRSMRCDYESRTTCIWPEDAGAFTNLPATETLAARSRLDDRPNSVLFARGRNDKLSLSAGHVSPGLCRVMKRHTARLSLEAE